MPNVSNEKIKYLSNPRLVRSLITGTDGFSSMTVVDIIVLIITFHH